MRLLHHSHVSEAIDLSRISGAGFQRPDKPNGFWISVEGKGDWLSYLEHESGDSDLPPHTHEIVLATDARILRIDSFEAIMDFSRSHIVKGGWASRVSASYEIDWNRVRTEWQGIIIAPYQRPARTHPESMWYYAWDCASGCIWDPAAIASTRLLPPERAVA